MDEKAEYIVTAPKNKMRAMVELTATLGIFKRESRGELFVECEEFYVAILRDVLAADIVIVPKKVDLNERLRASARALRAAAADVLIEEGRVILRSTIPRK